MGTNNLGLDDLIDELDEELFMENKNSIVQADAVSSTQRNIGGFQDMTNEEIEQFQSSQEYKEYKADIEQLNLIVSEQMEEFGFTDDFILFSDIDSFYKASKESGMKIGDWDYVRNGVSLDGC